MPEAPINVAGDGLVTSITFSTSPTSGFLHKGNLLAADFGQMRRVTRVSELLHNMWVLCLEGKRDLSTSKDSIWCVPLMTIKTKPFWPKLYRSKTSLSGNSISAFPPPKKTLLSATQCHTWQVLRCKAHEVAGSLLKVWFCKDVLRCPNRYPPGMLLCHFVAFRYIRVPKIIVHQPQRRSPYFSKEEEKDIVAYKIHHPPKPFLCTNDHSSHV